MNYVYAWRDRKLHTHVLYIFKYTTMATTHGLMLLEYIVGLIVLAFDEQLVRLQ